MIIASSLLGIHKDEFTKLYEVTIQLGAILQLWFYTGEILRFQGQWQFYVKLIVAVIPALILGKLFSDTIDSMLESPNHGSDFAFTWRYYFIIY